MLSKFLQFVKAHLADIILVIGVILISLLSFAAGYVVAKQQEKEPLLFEIPSTKHQIPNNIQIPMTKILNRFEFGI